MFYILGYLTGLVTAALIFAVLAFFRAAIERRVRVIERVLGEAGPKPQGFIVEPEAEDEKLRREIIERNRHEGKDTHISELL